MNFTSSSKLLTVLMPLIPILTWIVVMESLSRLEWIPSYIIPPPFEVLRALQEERAHLLDGLKSTLIGASSGLVISFIVGNSIAAILALSRLARLSLYPYAVFFQTVPVIALAPVLVIWFGFGQPTVIASAFICSVFPIIASSLLGLQSTDPGLVDLFKLYSASRWKLFFRLRVPFALPQILSGLRIASGLAVIGAIVGEFIGGGGLGSVVDSARTQQRMDLVFAAVLTSSLLGVLFIVGVNWITHLLLHPWHASAQKKDSP